MNCIRKPAIAWLVAIVGAVVLGVASAPADPPGTLKVLKLPLMKQAAKRITNAVPGFQTVASTIDALDVATRRDYATVCKVVEVGFEGRTRIVIGTMQTQVYAEKVEGCFRGDVSVKIQMPADAIVALDMESLWGCMSYNASTKVIEITLPPLKIIAVETYPHRAEVFPEYSGWCRFGFWDSGATGDLERSLLKATDWGQRVRDEVNPNAYHLRAAAAHEVRTFLRHLVEPTNPGIKVEVLP